MLQRHGGRRRARGALALDVLGATLPLADAAAELAFVVAWLAVRADARYSARRPGTEER